MTSPTGNRKDYWRLKMTRAQMPHPKGVTPYKLMDSKPSEEGGTVCTGKIAK